MSIDPGVVYGIGAFVLWIPAIVFSQRWARKEWPLNEDGANNAFAAVEGTCAALLWPLLIGIGVPAYLVARAAGHFLDKEPS